MENIEEKLAELEAMLFIHGEPLAFKRIATMLELEAEQVHELVEKLKETLALPSRGLSIVTDSEKVQMVTKAQYAKILESFVKEQLTQDLTPATLETLSIITYLGPISRAKLEYLRGVNSTFTLRSLLIRGLVEKIPDPERATGFVYQPSLDLLKHLGVQDQHELPEYEKYRVLLTKSQQQEGGE